MSQDHPVEVRNLAKTFYDEARGEVRAVDGIDFECRKGEIFGLLGANGAGKTTTLRILSTILEPTSGTARVMGHDVLVHPDAVRRRLGFYSASTALYPRLTARETLDFFARINGFPHEEVPERVEALVERFGIVEYQDVRVEKLSSGMKQKVSIARTVAHDPPVLIFDEPTVGLDVMNALEMQRIIRGLRQEGKTILFSTHIMSEAEKLCDRIAIIHHGRILACETLEGHRERTGEHYLEDIFVDYVGAPEEEVSEAAVLEEAGRVREGGGEADEAAEEGSRPADHAEEAATGSASEDGEEEAAGPAGEDDEVEEGAEEKAE